MILVDLDRVTVSRPGRELFTDLSLTLATGDRLGMVGLNGAGKTTLLRVLAGFTDAERGTVRRGVGSASPSSTRRPPSPRAPLAVC